MKQYRIRKATISDSVDIAIIYVSSWQYAYRSIVSQEYLDGLSADKYLEKMDMSLMHTINVLEVDGDIIGLSKMTGSTDADSIDYAQIQTIYFLPEYIGRGYGGALIEYQIAQARSQGYRGVIIWVLSENARARRTYERVGFVSDSSRIVYIGGKQLYEARYTIALDK